MLGDDELTTLARHARATIEHALGGDARERPRGEVYERLAATFVTLHWSADDELQGCIGSLEPVRPLWRDVAENARAAALRDPRGRALTLADVGRLVVEVSVLSPRTLVEFDGTEEGARAALVPDADGVVLTLAGRRATFLPQVWESLPDPGEFLMHLKAKAGLPPRFWTRHITLERYRVQKGRCPSRAPEELHV